MVTPDIFGLGWLMNPEILLHGEVEFLLVRVYVDLGHAAHYSNGSLHVN